jgi:hypothetical protein
LVVALSCRVTPDDAGLLQLVNRLGSSTNRPARPLHLQALLQLPRVADEQGEIGLSDAEDVLVDVAAELPPTPAWLVPAVEPSPRALGFHPVELSEVTDARWKFHYLHSPRESGRAYALTTRGGRMVAFCVSSPMDVPKLEDLLLIAGVSPGAMARVVSRVFAFELAPRNSISYLLARSAQEEKNLGVTELMTYVNPNMGFTGSSYRASGWRLIGDEPGTKYRYLDERYVTDRALHLMFGQMSDDRYRDLLENRFGVSAMQLEPLLVFHRHIR